MRTKQKLDIVPYICVIGLSFAMLVQMAYMYKLEVKYRQNAQKIDDVMYVVSTLTNELEEIHDKINALEHRSERIELFQFTEIHEEEEVVTQPEITINYDYEYVLRVVAAESRGEPFEGQMAVAQCIRETANATGMTPEAVVKQVGPTGVRQYTTPVDISLVTDSVREACERVFIRGESVTDEPIRYFYSTNNGFVSKWHENSLQYVMTIGCHKFFKR